MASSSPRTWRYNVFVSFHGPDVRKSFLSHLRKQFTENGITMFYDQDIERGQIITPALIRAIRGSRISILILSKKYASSSWCLDELLEILECKKAIGQIVMTIFYGVDPSDVGDQTGKFGIAFNETCAGKTEEERRRWSQALTDAANIAGEDFKNWDNEANMIKKIARYVSDKLNVTPSRDFDGMVGLEVHLRKMKSLLDLDYDGVKMVAISGPAGIGKTTIARALHSLLSNRFQLTCFLDNLRGSYDSGLDEYGLKLRLQDQLLSNILNKNDTRICHLGVIKERLRDQRVLVILDDVNSLKQLEALANETTWFGPGSRIVVTTENKELLQQHGINNTYHVGFPSDVEAIEILCRYAFRHNYPHDGFEELISRVTKLCGNLPLGLRVVGSSLRGKKKEEWEEVMHRLETILDHRDIEQVLKVGYESLHDNEQSLFLHIAVFFNYKDVDLVKAMFTDSKLDIKHGLKILANKSLIYVSIHGEIVMHKLLQQVGTNAVHREEPWKRRILVDALEICDVLERAKGTRAVSGISLDTSIINKVSISERAFERMSNLQFLKVYKSKDDGNDIEHIPEGMEFPPRLRLLHWEAYPSKCLPATFHPKYLVELYLQGSQFEKLWEGTQPLTNLKKMDLLGSLNLKELPDLSNATNLESLNLAGCKSLVEFPLSFGNLHKLELLQMGFCINLQVVPTHFNLASLIEVDMMGCSQLRRFPDISTNITELTIAETMLEELPKSIRLWSRLQSLNIYGRVWKDYFLDRSGADIEKLPDCIKDLHGLQELYIGGCPKLASLPELPRSLITLQVENCESLETVSFPFDSPTKVLYFTNCFKLSREARRVIIQQTGRINAYLPGKKIPLEFDHRAKGNSLTIRSDIYRFRFCVVVSPKQQIKGNVDIVCRTRIKGFFVDEIQFHRIPNIQTEHLFICESQMLDDEDGLLEKDVDILFDFSTTSHEVDIIECGVQVVMNGSISIQGSEQVFQDDDESLYDGSDESCSEQVSEDEDESCSEQVSKDDSEQVSEDAFVFLFILSLISNVLLYVYLKIH